MCLPDTFISFNKPASRSWHSLSANGLSSPLYFVLKALEWYRFPSGVSNTVSDAVVPTYTQLAAWYTMPTCPCSGSAYDTQTLKLKFLRKSRKARDINQVLVFLGQSSSTTILRSYITSPSELPYFFHAVVVNCPKIIAPFKVLASNSP